MDSRFYEKYGVVIFDSQTAATSGWACIAGRDPFFVMSSGDLTNDVTWITNIGWGIFVKKGMGKTPRFRAETFLRTKLSSLVAELGLKESHPREQAKTLSEILGSTMQFAHYHLGITAPPFGSLNNGIRQIFLPTETPYSIDIHTAAEQACQPYVNCEKNGEKTDGELLPVLFQRYQYARQILSSKLPAGRWSKISLTSIGDTKKLVDSWIAASEKPLLIKIIVEQMDAASSKLINYGSGAGLIANRARVSGTSISFNEHSWVTSVEYRMLRQRCRLTVLDIMAAESWVSNPVPLPQYEQYGEYSFSLGLYCESLWTALTRAINGNAAKTPVAAWIHSLDRVFCFEKAEILSSDYGLTVHGYGYGRIMIDADHAQKEKIPSLCLALNLVSPMLTTTKQPTASLPVEIAKPTSSQIFQIAMIRGDKAFFSAVDNKAVEEAARQSKSSTSAEFTI